MADDILIKPAWQASNSPLNLTIPLSSSTTSFTGGGGILINYKLPFLPSIFGTQLKILSYSKESVNIFDSIY